MSAYVDAVVEVRNIVVTDHVSGAVYFHGMVAIQTIRAIDSRVIPTQKPISIVAAEHDVVGDVEILRARILRVHGDTDTLDPAVPHGEPS